MRKFICVAIIGVFSFISTGCVLKDMIKEFMSRFNGTVCVEKQDGTIECWGFPAE